jgi:geranylgeranylglycerol-phosphate geranylgeranyltransferase
VATIFMLAAVAISPLPYVISIVGPAYLGIIIAADLILLYGLLLSWSAPSRASAVIKYGMLIVLLAYIIGGF